MTADLDVSHDPVRHEFDAQYYLAQNPDVAAAGMDPFEHFMNWGWREGRDPSRRFSLANYLDANPDIGAAGVNPFSHYVATGRGEGRPLKHDLGFRYEILKSAVPLEDRIRSMRAAFPDPEPSDVSELDVALQRVDRSPRLHVSISHDDFTTNLGGVQLCLKREARALRAGGFDHIHLYPATPSVVIDTDRARPLIGVLVNGEQRGLFPAEVLIDRLGRIGKGREVSFAAHSLIGHNIANITAVLQAMGVREGYYWVHDFSSVCAHYALLRNDVSFCGAPPVDSAACGVCVYHKRRLIHRAEHARFFREFAITVLAPSEAALALWSSSFPVSPKAALAHPHARLKKRRRTGLAAPLRPEGAPLRVAFLGMPVDHKGWPVYADLVERFIDDPRYEFHHLGKEPASLGMAHFTAVEPSEKVNEPMMAAIEELDIDVAIIWSLCPETFCFTAYEAVAGGAAVITNPDAGNVPRFVGDRDIGLVAADEHDLVSLFETGEPLNLSRAVRGETLYSITYSRMTADFLGKDA